MAPTSADQSDDPSASPLLSAVIPAFNEAERIGDTLERVVSYLSGEAYSWEVVVVDDGSTDDTAAMAKEWAHTSDSERMVHVQTIPHGGKGWAVKKGMLAASGQYRFMSDADLAMPIEQLDGFLERMEEGYDIVIGSRQKAGARRYGEPVGRHVMGRAFNWSIRLLVVGGFEDTQCGFKCFRGDVAKELFSLQRTKGFAFDVEILYMAMKKGLRVMEMPIDWYHQRASKVRPFVDSFQMLRDSLSLRLRNVGDGDNL